MVNVKFVEMRLLVMTANFTKDQQSKEEFEESLIDCHGYSLVETLRELKEVPKRKKILWLDKDNIMIKDPVQVID